MRERDRIRIRELKHEAIARAEGLGHKLRTFDRHKDTEVYYSTLCARCSAYLLVTALGCSGRAVEERCQKLCVCGRPLTPDDLDGSCEGCRGNLLTLYPKTPAIKAKDARFIEYRRKSDPECEPGPDEVSDYFWRCQQCYRRLGPGYQGDPDERGFCSACNESEKIWAKRKADAIEAAGGLRAWKRRHLIGKLLTPIDFVAMFIVIIMGTALIATFLLIMLQGAMSAAWREIRTFVPLDKSDIVVLGIILGALGWCTLRWKALNRSPNDKL